jgi:hypothetical protein
MANGFGFGVGVVAEATANYTPFRDKIPGYLQGKALAWMEWAQDLCTLACSAKLDPLMHAEVLG